MERVYEWLFRPGRQFGGFASWACKMPLLNNMRVEYGGYVWGLLHESGKEGCVGMLLDGSTRVGGIAAFDFAHIDDGGFNLLFGCEWAYTVQFTVFWIESNHAAHV